jgi:hypothetical protein
MDLIGTKRNTLEPLTVTDRDVTVARAACLWAEVMPEQMMPDYGEFVRFLLKAGKPANLYRAIQRAAHKSRMAAKYREQEMTFDEIERYVMGVARSEAAGPRIVAPNKNLNRNGIRRL